MQHVQRVPVVGGLAYVERVRLLPSSFTAALAPEPENRYFPHAIAVLVNDEKVGYVAPEVSRRYFAPLAERAGQPVTCKGRLAGPSDRGSSGVVLLLDFSALGVEPLP